MLPAVIAARFALIYRILDKKYGFDEFNEWFFARGARGLGQIHQRALRDIHQRGEAEIAGAKQDRGPFERGHGELLPRSDAPTPTPLMPAKAGIQCLAK